MDIKTKVYLDNLYKHLGVCGKDEITEDHIEEITRYINNRNLKIDVFKELIKNIPDILSYLKSSLEYLNKTYTQIIEAGVSDVQSLENIIISLNSLLTKNDLTEKDKDRIFDLIKSFQKSYEETLRRNDENKKLIIVASFTTVTIFALIVYKAVGGKGGDNIIEVGTKVGTKMVEA